MKLTPLDILLPRSVISGFSCCSLPCGPSRSERSLAKTVLFKTDNGLGMPLSFRKFPLPPPATRALYILRVDLESMGGLREKVFTHYFAVVLSECDVHAGTDYRGNI